MKKFNLRKWQELDVALLVENGIPLLETFCYEAIFIPGGLASLPHNIIYTPEIYAYINDFGTQKDDYCLLAKVDRKVVGAVWVRLLAGEIKGFGNIDNETPELAIAVLKEYRNQGIGTGLMLQMIDYLRENGYAQVSLSVHKDNYATNIYQKLGFEIIKENNEDYVMVLRFEKNN